MRGFSDEVDVRIDDVRHDAGDLVAVATSHALPSWKRHDPDLNGDNGTLSSVRRRHGASLEKSSSVGDPLFRID